MQIDSVMSLASMIAAAVTAVAAVRGGRSWATKAMGYLELAKMLEDTGDKRSESVVRDLRADAVDIAKRGIDGHHRSDDTAMRVLIILQTFLLAVAVVSGIDVTVPAACFIVSAISVLERRR